MNIVYGFLCLFFLILFHEFGHFLAAKKFGVKVESFSIGFGPVLLHKKYKGTDYRLSLIPLGGYCGMKGEKDFQKSLEAKLDHIEAEEDSLYGIHPVKRAVIAFAGPFFNLFFTFFAFFLIALIGYTYYSYSAKVIMADEVYENVKSAAKQAGMQTGDVITRINGKEILNFSDIVTEISSRPDEYVIIEVNRNDTPLKFTVRTELDKASGTGKIGVTADTATAAQYTVESLSFFPAIWKGITETADALRLTVTGLSTLFKGVDIKETVSGPARIADMLGTTAVQSFSESFITGIINMFSFLAYISISLFIMNLLPVPILDGGLILFALIELVTRKKIPPKVLYYIQFIGLAFLIALFCIGFSGDMAYFFNNFRGIQK